MTTPSSARPDADAGLGPRDILGVPLMPAGRLTDATNRLRHLVGRLRLRTAPPPIAILEGVLGLLDHAALVALCELDVPDRLDAAMPMDQLARQLGCDIDGLTRLIRYGAARGWVGVNRQGHAAPTAVTGFLRRDHPGGWRAWVTFAGSEAVTGATHRLADSIRLDNDTGAFETANGAPFFEWMAGHPDIGAAFDAAMAAGGRVHALALDAAVDWSEARRVCDVGGGDGTLLLGLLSRQPHLRGVLLDLPSVVGGAPGGERLEVVAGDAFESVPSGCDSYLFVNVLHDWDDDDCVRLLRTTSRCADASARMIVVDGERRVRPMDDIAARTDLLMLALAPGGRERTTDEFASLGTSAGLRLDRTHHLGSGDRAHVFLHA